MAGQAIATRVNGTLYFLQSDHLGSTSLMTNSSGYSVSGTTARYLPYGGYRTTPTAGLTEMGYTGHHHNDSLGLIYMNARFFVLSLGRFATADSIVPSPANPQSHNRYTYVLGNPLRLVDPSGHCAGTEGDPDSLWYDAECWSYLENEFCQDVDCGTEGWKRWITPGSAWSKGELEIIHESLLTAKNALQSVGIQDWQSQMTDFKFSKQVVPDAIPNARFERSGNGSSYQITIFGNLFSESAISVVFVILHEIGHAIDHRISGDALFDDPSASVMGRSFLLGAQAGNFSAGGTCFRDYSCGDIREGWADAFAMFSLQTSGAYLSNWNMEWLVNDDLYVSNSRSAMGWKTGYYMGSSDIDFVTNTVRNLLSPVWI